MDNYGVPVYDKKNHLIAYRINESEYASVIIYYNENNLLCNKIEIKHFDKESLTLNGEALISWIDTRTDFGFIR